MHTDLPNSRRGPALILSQEDEAQDAALEIDEKEIPNDDGIDTTIKRLDHLHLKDKSYMESLSEEEKSEISFRKSSNANRFGDGKLVTARKNCDTFQL